MKNRDGKAKSGSMQPKRRMSAEDAVVWAWREELPKAPRLPNGPDGFRPSWRRTEEFGEYLSLVEKFGVNRYGCVPDFSAERWPHGDAVAIADAIFALDALAIELPEDWRPAPELDAFDGLGAKAVSDAWRKMTVADAEGGMRLRLKPSDLVIRHAVLGLRKDLGLDDVTVETECGGNGKPKWFVRVDQHAIVGRNADGSDRTELRTIEMPGLDKRGYPMANAYQKRFLDPDPVWTIVARAEHEIWHSALSLMAAELAGRLETVEIGEPVIAARPWEGPPVRPARILPDLVAEREREERRMDAIRARGARWFRKYVAGVPSAA
jgi:hypothetical protein